MDEILQRIKDNRKKKGFTYDNMANELNTSPAAYRKIELNQTKLRIQSEIGDNNVWITKGREIENYLTSETIENWLLDKHQIKGSFLNELNVKIEDSISKVDTLNKLKYNLNKSKYASEIIDFIEPKDLESLDLKNKVIGAVEEIRKWNKMNIPKV